MKFVNLMEDFNASMDLEEEDLLAVEEECEDCDELDECSNSIIEKCGAAVVKEADDASSESEELEECSEITESVDKDLFEEFDLDFVAEDYEVDEDELAKSADEDPSAPADFEVVEVEEPTEEVDGCAFLDMRDLVNETIEKCMNNNFTRIEAIQEIINQINQTLMLVKNRTELDKLVDAAYSKAGIPIDEIEETYFNDLANREAPEDDEADIDVDDIDIVEFDF